MLYVFHVDTGTMMTFDMSLALESVANLKHYVEQGCRIPIDKQVLLVSGGESLDDRAKVCSYAAGTDTNPIFLFSKSVIESTTPPCASVDYGSDYDFKSKVREAQDLPASYETVVHRAQLAKQFHECAKQQTKICEKLVHDQHLQQQGWAAVIANLEDLTEEFKRRADVFEKSFNDYLSEHDNYLTFLQYFNDDLQILAKIPIIPSLLDCENCETTDVETEASEETVKGEDSGLESCINKKPFTLLEWISATDSRSTMDQLFEHCSKGLEQFDEKIFKSLHSDIEKAIETSNHTNMKEVKGLGDRLFGLEQLMLEAKRYVREQADLAQSFLQNQNRAGNLGDTSILPDLCDSHRKQLLVMLHNHEQLCDIRRRCTRAKEELSVNLYHRLRWVMYVENLMLDANHKLVIYHDNLKRLRQHLEVLQQIHVAPATYLSAVAEVVRRRAFSQAFLLWASELACHLLTLHNEEVTRRKDFQSVFEGHFLNALFPGMDDLPPNFATQAPSIFDSTLPKISTEDIENLKQALPDLTEHLTVPDMSSITNFFLVKSIVKTELDKVDDRGIEEKLVQVVNEVGLASNLDQNLLKPTESENCLTAHGLAHLKDLDKGCESETDTEEFEKVCQSPLDLQFDKDLSSPRPRSQDATTITEDNLQTSRTEHDRLKSVISRMAQLSKQAIVQLRSELSDLKSLYVSQKSSIEIHYESLSNSWENLNFEMDKEKEIIQRISLDHELEVNDLRKLIEVNNTKIKSLEDKNTWLEDNLQKANESNEFLQSELTKSNLDYKKEIDDVKVQLENSLIGKEKCLKETSDRLTREHRIEIENLRTRFRLMTGLDRSPSDPNLEKIEKSEPSNEQVVQHIRKNCEDDIQKAIEHVIKVESESWQKMMDEKINEMRETFNVEKADLIQNITNRVTEEKDKQIEVLRNREAALNLECIKYKSTIQQLTENEIENSSSKLLCKVETLEKENCQLEAELSMERSKRFNPQEMVASVAVCEGFKVDAATSPVKHKEKLSKSQTSLIKSSKLSIESCSVGDAVLIIWDNVHENYTILQESNFLYFLHTDCLETLGLRKPSSEDKRVFYCTGEVLEKEFCHAKKGENRYKVPKGTKFYRVKVRPLSPLKDMTRSHQSTSQYMTHSQTASAQPSEQLATDSACHSLPSSPTKEQSMEKSTKILESTSKESNEDR